MKHEDWPPHKCTVWDYCILDNEMKLIFCAFCHKVIGFEKDGRRTLKPIALDKEHQVYKETEYSDDIRRDSI